MKRFGRLDLSMAVARGELSQVRGVDVPRS